MAEWLHKTNTGRVVYERAEHHVQPRDVLRMARKILDPDPSDPHFVEETLALFDLKTLALEIWLRQGIELQAPPASGLGSAVESVIAGIIGRLDPFRRNERRLYERYLQLIREYGLRSIRRGVPSRFASTPDTPQGGTGGSVDVHQQLALRARDLCIDIRDLIVGELGAPAPSSPAPTP